MNAKRLPLAITVLLAVIGLWFARSAWRTHAPEQAGMVALTNTPPAKPSPDPSLRPPDPTRRFRDLTPEQRVELARQPQGPGG